MNQLEEVLDGVEGWLSIDEATLLHDLASQIRLPQMVLEVGTYRGRSMIAMALDAGVPLFGVDPHSPSDGDPFPFGDNDRQVLMANLVQAGVAWKVRLLDVQSEFAAKGWPGHRLGLLYIDGAHSVVDVNIDLAGWLPYVDEGAWVAFHDANTSCVIEAVKDRTDLEFVQTVGLIGLYRYRKPLTAPEMVRKAVEDVNQYAELISVDLPGAVNIPAEPLVDPAPARQFGRATEWDARAFTLENAENLPIVGPVEPTPDPEPAKPPKRKPVVATRPKRKS